jgi:hypothetical protein
LEKVTKNSNFWIFSSLIFECNHSKSVPRPEKRENSLKIGQLLPILATFCEFKSVFEQSW